MTALALVGLAFGCTARGRPIVNVDIVDRSGRALDKPAAAMLDRAALDAAAKRAIGSFSGFELRDAKSDEMGWQLTVEVAMMIERPPIVSENESAREGEVHRATGVMLTLASLGPDKARGTPIRFDGDALVARNVPTSTRFQTLVLEAIEEAARSLSGSIRLADAKDEEILSALSSEDRGLKRRAIIMAGERRLSSALPRLSEIVRGAGQEQDEAAVLKAIGALVALGDDRAVAPLIDAGRQRPGAYLSQIIFAVGALGGKEAEAYLFTVSNGHSDPEVRKNASDALAELERRKALRSDSTGPGHDTVSKPE